MSDDLRALGRSSRRYYNLQDLFEDISRGLVNVSREDATKFGLDEDSFLRLAHNNLLPNPSLIERQKKLGTAHPDIKRVMGEGLTAWTEQELVTGVGELNIWRQQSQINSLGAAAVDLFQRHQHPRDTLFFFQGVFGAGRFYRKSNLTV